AGVQAGDRRGRRRQDVFQVPGDRQRAPEGQGLHHHSSDAGTAGLVAAGTEQRLDLDADLNKGMPMTASMANPSLTSAGPGGASPAGPRLSRRLQALAPSPTIAWSARARALAQKGHPVLDLTLGEPDFDTFPHIKAAAEQAIREGKTK